MVAITSSSSANHADGTVPVAAANWQISRIRDPAG